MIAHDLTLSLQLLGLAFFGSLAFCGFMRHVGLGDAPDSRSAHQGVIPTGGGVGVIAGLGLACSLLGVMGPEMGEGAWVGVPAFLSLVFAVGILGLCDDALTLSAKPKFLLLIILCSLATWVIGPVTSLPFGATALPLPYWLGFLGSVLWLFVVTNAVNFMDGINGMVGLCLSIAFIGLFGMGLAGMSPATLLFAPLALAALFGFLPYNFRRRATLFAGDVGSLTLGFLFAGTVLFLVRDAGALTPVLYAGPLLILPFLVDVLLTLMRRASKGENLLQAHSSHLYQRMNRAGGGRHLPTTWVYGLAFLACANLAVFGVELGWIATPWALLGMTGLLSLIYLIASKRLN